MRDDNSDIYLELLKNVSSKVDATHSSVQNLEKKLDLHIQKVGFELESIRELDGIQNSILDEHHKRSDELARDNILREQKLTGELKVIEARIVKLEVPQKVLSQLKRAFLWIGGFAGAIAAIFEVLSYLGILKR